MRASSRYEAIDRDFRICFVNAEKRVQTKCAGNRVKSHSNYMYAAIDRADFFPGSHSEA